MECHTLSVKESYNICPNCIVGTIQKKAIDTKEWNGFMAYTCSVCGCNRHIFDWPEINCKHEDIFTIL